VVAMDRMKALSAEGLGFDQIALKLNEEGSATRTGKPWHCVGAIKKPNCTAPPFAVEDLGGQSAIRTWSASTPSCHRGI